MVAPWNQLPGEQTNGSQNPKEASILSEVLDTFSTNTAMKRARVTYLYPQLRKLKSPEPGSQMGATYPGVWLLSTAGWVGWWLHGILAPGGANQW